jgi:hypothetical protein
MTAQWTEGVCGDGAAILRDGEMVTVSDVLVALNEREQCMTRITELEAAIEKALRHAGANGMADWPAFNALRVGMKFRRQPG